MNTLSAFLLQAGITQSDFAQKIGVVQATVSRLVRGDMLPSLGLALKIESETGGAVPVQSWDHPPAHGPAPQSKQGAAG